MQLQNPRRYPESRARPLRPWLESLVASLAPMATSLAVRFVSDREMRRLNSRYRGKDYATDVLSFLGETDSPEPHLGDLVISVPTARRQAGRKGHGVERELRILILHGLLHLLGHDHETDDGEMERLEEKLRRRWLGATAVPPPEVSR